MDLTTGATSSARLPPRPFVILILATSPDGKNTTLYLIVPLTLKFFARAGYGGCGL